MQYYRDADENVSVPGLMHVKFGPYHVRDVKFVAAFDVDAKKVGFDLSEAIFASENNTIKIADVPPTNVTVQRGPTLDGIGKYYAETIEVSDAEPSTSSRRSRTPRSTCWCPTCRWAPKRPTSSTPSAPSTPGWRSSTRCRCSSPRTRCGPRSSDAGVPIVGDDIKSQVGATITHRVMAKLFEDRGVQLDRTNQLNVGGNMDFMNMLERSRLESKKISKTQAVTSNLQREFNAKDVHIGPSDHVGWLDDRKWAYVRLEGRAFGDVPLNLEYKLEVWDSPNSAGVIIDAVRAAKIARTAASAARSLPRRPTDEEPARAAGGRRRPHPAGRLSSKARFFPPRCGQIGFRSRSRTFAVRAYR